MEWESKHDSEYSEERQGGMEAGSSSLTWYVFRGDWLWCGKGMRPEMTPMMVKGSISRWVVLLRQEGGRGGGGHR